MNPSAEPIPGRGLCPRCAHVKPVRTARSLFLLCRLASRDPSYPKYPPQPRERCAGFEERAPSGERAPGPPPGPAG